MVDALCTCLQLLHMDLGPGSLGKILTPPLNLGTVSCSAYACLEVGVEKRLLWV